ncbi:hypothetical protein AB0M50_56495, partial [Nonomuraea fuscirosea]|uniref:hypothetical protein n=1 Tax=Nonomuraea fuscirosea TaxID=1291556 RepID=UPI003435FCC8
MPYRPAACPRRRDALARRAARCGSSRDACGPAFGWPGGGGSFAYADPARGVAFALTKTRLVP